MRKGNTAIPLGVVKPVTLVVQETLVAHPTRLAVLVEGAVQRGMFEAHPPLSGFLISPSIGTTAARLMVCVDAAWTVALAQGILLLPNALIPVMHFALQRTSVAVRPPSPQ